MDATGNDTKHNSIFQMTNFIIKTVATGAAAIMAIRVLLDHDVPEENILIVSLLMAEIGVQSIAYAFPKVIYFCFDSYNLILLIFLSITGSNRNISRWSRDKRQVLRHSRNWQLWGSLLWNRTLRYGLIFICNFTNPIFFYHLELFLLRNFRSSHLLKKMFIRIVIFE